MSVDDKEKMPMPEETDEQAREGAGSDEPGRDDVMGGPIPAERDWGGEERRKGTDPDFDPANDRRKASEGAIAPEVG